MAEPSERRSGSWVAFLIGALVIALIVAVFLVYSGRAPAPTDTVDIDIAAPSVPSLPPLTPAPNPEPIPLPTPSPAPR